MPTYNASSAVNPNTTHYAQRMGSGYTPSYMGNTYSVPSVPSMGGSINRPFNQSYLAPRSPASTSAPVSPVNDTRFKITPDTGEEVDNGDEGVNTPNPSAGYQFISDATNALKSGDGGVYDQTIDQAGQKINTDLQRLQTAEDPAAVHAEIKSDPFYQDEVWDSLFSAGVAAQSGGNAQQIYEAGVAGAERGRASDERNAGKLNAIQNREELLKNYTPDSVANYIATGNPAGLRARQYTLEEQTAQRQAEEDRQDARQRASFQFQSDIQEQKNIAAENRAENRRQAQAAADEKKAIEGRYEDIRKNTYQLSKTMRKNETTRLTGFTSANKTLKNFFAPGASDEQKQQSLQLASETAFNAIQGSSTAEKTVSKINHMLGQPGLVNVIGNQISWASGVPREQQAKYLQGLLDMDEKSWKETYDDDYMSQADTWIDENTTPEQKKKILASVSQGAGRKITNEMFDKWYDRTYNGGEVSSNAALAPNNTQQAKTPVDSLAEKYKVK